MSGSIFGVPVTEEVMVEYLKSQLAGVQSGMIPTFKAAPPPPPWVQPDPDIVGHDKLIRMLGMRMHLREGDQLPFEFIMPHKSKETVYVFIVHEGKPTYLEDGWNLYPSDALVTKLRLLIG